jgi:hypothetical protein
MNAKTLITSDYITAVEIDKKELTMTIDRVVREKIADIKNPDKQKLKGVIFFKGVERGWVMNRTNVQCLIALFGVETDHWIGKRVTIYATPVKVGPKTELGIRIKGSPDITAPVIAVIEMPRKKPQRMQLIKTTPGAKTAEAPASDLPKFDDDGEQPPPPSEDEPSAEAVL